jgi:DNA-binding cell septation regulator SpoVG
MNITRVQVHVMDQPNSVKAFADIIIDDEFIVRGLAIREDREGYAFVTMPYKIKNETRFDVAHPINEPCRKYIEGKVIDEYERVLNVIAASHRPPRETNPYHPSLEGPKEPLDPDDI